MAPTPEAPPSLSSLGLTVGEGLLSGLSRVSRWQRFPESRVSGRRR